jgi:excisionase family DNA binding protein
VPVIKRKLSVPLQAQAPTEQRVLSVRAAAAYLGVSSWQDYRNPLLNFESVRKYLDISRSTLLRYISARKIEAIKLDGGWKFRAEAIERFLQRRTQKAA